MPSVFVTILLSFVRPLFYDVPSHQVSHISLSQDVPQSCERSFMALRDVRIVIAHTAIAKADEVTRQDFYPFHDIPWNA